MNDTLKQLGKNKLIVEKLVQDCKKNLGYDKDPTIVFLENEENAAQLFGKTGYYDPSSQKIAIYTTGRHPKDCLRSLAHELVHHAQNCRGDLLEASANAGDGYAQNDEVLRELEREAYEKGNLMFRDFEDGLKYGSK